MWQYCIQHESGRKNYYMISKCIKTSVQKITFDNQMWSIFIGHVDCCIFSSNISILAPITGCPRLVFLLSTLNFSSFFLLYSLRASTRSSCWKSKVLTLPHNIKLYSTKKRASRASALRADGVSYTMGLVLTYPISPIPWTWPRRSLGACSTLPSDY